MAIKRINYFNEFEEKKHFRPAIHWENIKNLSGEDFLWEILEPVSKMVKHEKYEIVRCKKLSPAQKSLYFFWFLDAEVTNGGFTQFYLNGNEKYLAPIQHGLQLIGYKNLLKVVNKSEVEYDKHSLLFDNIQKAEDVEKIYNKLSPVFDKMDDWYYKNEEKHYNFFENFLRENIDEFIIKL